MGLPVWALTGIRWDREASRRPAIDLHPTLSVRLYCSLIITDFGVCDDYRVQAVVSDTAY